MKKEDFELQTTDDIPLRGSLWYNQENLKAGICLIHGHGEHHQRYAAWAEKLVEHGYGVAAVDLRGHGKSGGPRGHSPDYERMMDDISEILLKTEEVFDDIPRFLYGHSMGGNLVLNYAIREQPILAGVIATSPWLRLAFEPPAIQITLAKFVGKLWPGFTQKTKLDAKALSRDAEVVRAYVNDPLVHDKISASLFFGCYQAGLDAIEQAENLNLHLLLMHGTEDRLTSWEGSMDFAGKSAETTSLKLWDGYYHELHNEPEKELVFAELLSWLDKHC